MKRVLRWVVWFLISILLVLGAALLLKDTIIKSIAERRLGHKTGLEIRIGRVEVGLFSPTVALENFRVFNPPDFGGARLLDVSTGSCLLDWQQLKTNRLHFNDLRLHLAELNVIKRKDGALNLESVKEIIRINVLKDRNKKKWIFRFGGIDRLDLTVEKVNYIDEKQPTNSLQFDLGIKNEIITSLRTEEDFNQWLHAFVMRMAFQESMKNPRLKENGPARLWDALRPGRTPKTQQIPGSLTPPKEIETNQPSLEPAKAAE